ncbi:hypothetical protein [Methylobacterium sp. Leaf93]|uniref:hypothetical protein n=1 Tax=Methylobacterium sp. Leaf93 TaxID=1736249 RepID=UPI0006F545AC|nr:hypothetical protein [Methylobacterium sp. Leaf93]KQP02624.1 hypothetical protein ASF26_14440 [Methylobacterium sp. Leaf93]
MTTAGITFSREVSATDRNGVTYTTDEMREIFRKLYPINPKAIALMFPDLTGHLVRRRALDYGITAQSYWHWTDEEDATLRKLWPDKKAAGAALGRSNKAMVNRAKRLGIATAMDLPFSPAELAMAARGLTPPGRCRRAADTARKRRGITMRAIKSVAAISPVALLARIGDLVHRGHTPTRREEIIFTVNAECLAGRCSAEAADLQKAVKKATTAVYKLNPERGAPVSMDARLFDDGSATVGDRISSDTFHF